MLGIILPGVEYSTFASRIVYDNGVGFLIKNPEFEKEIVRVCSWSTTNESYSCIGNSCYVGSSS